MGEHTADMMRAVSLLFLGACGVRGQILNLKLEPNEDVKCEPGVLMHSERTLLPRLMARARMLFFVPSLCRE